VQVPDRARGDPLEAAREIPAARYPGADSLLLAVRSRAARPPSPPISISLFAIADEVLAPDGGRLFERSSVRVRCSLAATTP